jgi:hypothetical protein
VIQHNELLVGFEQVDFRRAEMMIAPWSSRVDAMRVEMIVVPVVRATATVGGQKLVCIADQPPMTTSSRLEQLAVVEQRYQRQAATWRIATYVD